MKPFLKHALNTEKTQMDTDSTFQTQKQDLKNQQGSCPGGTCDNSPTFQRWVDQCREHRVPKGRLKGRAIPQPSRRDWTIISLVLPNVETLGYCRASLRDEEQILVALEVPVRAQFGR